MTDSVVDGQSLDHDFFETKLHSEDLKSKLETKVEKNQSDK